MAANEGVLKAIVSFFTEVIQIWSLVVFLTIYVLEGINFIFSNKKMFGHVGLSQAKTF